MSSRLDIPPTHLIKKLFRRLFQTLSLRKPEFTRWQSRPAARKHGRSLAIRVVDCGSNGAAEQEIQAIFNPFYDAERFGLHLVASPRHADVLLVSGPLVRNMEAALLAAFEAMPEPRRVVTVGDDLDSGGVFRDAYGVVPLPPEILAARVAHIPGNPPSPADILNVLLEIDWR